MEIIESRLGIKAFGHIYTHPLSLFICAYRERAREKHLAALFAANGVFVFMFWFFCILYIYILFFSCAAHERYPWIAFLFRLQFSQINSIARFFCFVFLLPKKNEDE